MKKIVNVILVIGLLISIGFNIYFCLEIKKVTKIDNDLIEEIAKLGNELDKSKETLNSKDIEITELKTQISSKEEKIKGIQESILSLESEKEDLLKQLGELKDAQKQETTTKKENTDNNGKANNGEQSSTTGGQGDSQNSGAQGGDANIGTENGTTSDIDKFCAEFGATYGGSGLDTSGFDHGDGGASWILN